MPARTIPTAPSSVPATFVRGGTSKAVFFHEKDIPPPGPFRDRFLLRMMGSPDPTQIDGMGGGVIVTSKVAIVRPSSRPDADVDYTFAQVGLTEPTVSYDANCGNISAGVGPFAINEGLLKEERWDGDRRVVRIWNTGMKILLIAHVPVDKATGRALEKGDYAISGCPGTGAPILMDYSQTANPSNMLPTGHVIDNLECSYGNISASYCSVGNPIIFVKAEDLGIQGNETVATLNANKELLTRIKEVRGRVTIITGNCTDWHKVDEESPMIPMVALVSRPTSKEGHIQSRLFLDNHCHPSMAGTAAVCTAACSRIRGSIVNSLLSPAAFSSEATQIQHPAGYLPIWVKTGDDGTHELPSFERLGFVRTSRYIMQGNLSVPADLQETWESPVSTSNSNLGQQDSVQSPVNGQINGQVNGHGKSTDNATDKVEVTKRLVSFVNGTSFEDLDTTVIQKLRQYLLDFIGVTELGANVAESSSMFIKGVEALTAGSTGNTKVFGTEKHFSPQYAALLNGAFAHSLDFDDTHIDSVLHPGCSAIAACLTEIQSHPDAEFKDMLLAIALGYEVTCRVGMALGTSSWQRGFHNTSIAGIFGAVAVLAKLRNLDVSTTENAFGLAVSYASGSMQYLSNGAYNKRLHPGMAAHNAFIVVAMAQAGVIGAAEPIEGVSGLIKAYTDIPESKVDLSGLGRTWEFINTGLKPYPACRLTHGEIELAGRFSEIKKSGAVESIHIVMDPTCYPVVGDPKPNKVHPKNIVDGQFSVYYQTAASFLYGPHQGWGIYDHLEDSSVHEICDKITVEKKAMPNKLSASMSVKWQDGEQREMYLEDALWEVPNRSPQNEEVVDKFRALTTKTMGGERTEKVVSWIMNSENGPVTELMQLLV